MSWDDRSSVASIVSGMVVILALMLAGRRDGMPLLYVHKFGKDFRHLASHGMMGTDFDSCCHHYL